MGLKSDIGRIRQIDDLDRDAFIAAKRRHEARLVIHKYENYDVPFYEFYDDIQEPMGKPKCEIDESRKRNEANVATARDLLGEDTPERWRADQQRIERYLLCTNGNLDDATNCLAWGADPDTMWAHHQHVLAERGRKADAKIYAIITKRFAVEQEKGSPIRFENHPRYGTPVYEDGSIGDPDFYPRGWSWPLPDFLDDWLCVTDEMDEVPLSDEERLQEVTKFLEKEFDFDFALLCPAPNEQFPKFEHIQYL